MAGGEKPRGCVPATQRTAGQLCAELTLDARPLGVGQWIAWIEVQLGILRVHHFPNAHHLRRFVERVAVVNVGPAIDGDPSIDQIVLVAFE